jgi:hypothetical protein
MAKKKVVDKENAGPSQVLAWAIESTGVAQVVRQSAEGLSAKVLFRVTEKRTWLAALEYTLARADGWSAHVCQQYFMRGGRLVYGWNFILQASERSLLDAASCVSGLLRDGVRAAPKLGSRGSLDSFPLVGAPRYRTANIQFDPRLPGPGRGGPSHKGGYSVTEKL